MRKGFFTDINKNMKTDETEVKDRSGISVMATCYVKNNLKFNKNNKIVRHFFITNLLKYIKNIKVNLLFLKLRNNFLLDS